MKIKNYYKNALKYISLIFICLVLANARVLNTSPFLFPFLFACVYVGIDEKIVSAIGIGTYLLVSPTLENLYIVLASVSVMLICFYIHKLLKRKRIFNNFACFRVNCRFFKVTTDKTICEWLDKAFT